jgi:hypothetical protein
MRAEITGDGDELTVTLDADELPLAATDASLRTKLPESAGSIADGVLSMIGGPPVPGDPRKIRVIHVRMTRVQVVAETTLCLDGEREVWA